ncbi:toll/interleukin-1 receptor domain-containing protein [Lentzea sp. BCCO 10_0856]|uniref:Toll/interleukin-1 receptor domain-containing protein n=1 Tax=Lentzea miocenica TaxID=3095431 RepID=A0ABU4SW24_9PSEU|nr:toll/interleukin-1 receptor domain-containing protein [Lentzea sp. BCCO 10_0856]MDX8029948.1 toll/interleukin-1 receptor domain-containing protein [Lentzea sp. BCCO 10_0856]
MSHAGPDKERFVIPFSLALWDNGVRAWVDRWELKLGESLVGQLFDEGIAKSDVLIAVLSKHSAASRWMTEEVRAAINLRISGRIRVIPIRIDDVEIPPALLDITWIDVDPTDVQLGLQRVLRAIYDVSERPPLGSPPAWAVPLQTRIGRAVSGCPGFPELGDLPSDRVRPAVATWFTSCEEAFADVLRGVAEAVRDGDDVDWAIGRVRNSAAPAYAALLVSYAYGVAATAVERDELVWEALHGHPMPLYRVVDPQYVDGLLSTRLRRVLRPVFDLVRDTRYEDAFEEYEYLRSLIEVHDSVAAPSLGEFARRGSPVGERMAARLERLLGAEILAAAQRKLAAAIENRNRGR